MITVVEACVSNIDGETRTSLAELDAKTNVYPCLDHCGYCHRGPFIVVDGELRTGDSHAELLEASADQ